MKRISGTQIVINFIGSHPGCTFSEIRTGTGLDSSVVNSAIWATFNDGRVLRAGERRRESMRLKMNTPGDSVIVESNLVSQFYPDFESGGELTTIETVSSDGKTFSVKVKHSFVQVTSALATAWSVDEKKAEGAAQ